MTTESKRILICYAHPDDESFGLGAFLGKCRAEGVETTLVCATNGEVGTVAPEKLHGYGSVAELRLAELNCAAQVLGFKEVIALGYRDSGMMQGTDKDHPDCLWQAPLEAVSGRIVEVIRRVRPQIVITFDPFGGYGHPDHIKIHQATLAALEAVKGESGSPQKLYYSAFPKLMVRIGVGLVRLSGRDPRKMGVNHDLDFQAVLDATLPVHAVVNVSEYHDIGREAAACHDSQSSPRGMFPGGDLLMRALTRVQRFTRVIPAPRQGEPLEYDVFTGIRLGQET